MDNGWIFGVFFMALRRHTYAWVGADCFGFRRCGGEQARLRRALQAAASRRLVKDCRNLGKWDFGFKKRKKQIQKVDLKFLQFLV